MLDPVDVGTEPSGVVPVAAPALLVTPDATDLAWAKLRFGPDGWDRVLAALPVLRDDTAAVPVWNAVRDAVRDASLDPAYALEIVETGLPPARSDVSSPRCSASPSTSSPASTPRSTSAPPGPSGCAASPRGCSTRRSPVPTASWRRSAWRSGRRPTPTGSAPGTTGATCRRRRPGPRALWSLVERWCGLQTGTELLDDALRRDPSASGRVHAARARARRPDAAAKEAAWALLVEPSSLGAYELYATGDGFWDAGQDELTAPYVARYFAEIGGTAAFREGWALGQVATQAFPRTAATPRGGGAGGRRAGDRPRGPGPAGCDRRHRPAAPRGRIPSAMDVIRRPASGVPPWSEPVPRRRTWPDG